MFPFPSVSVQKLRMLLNQLQYICSQWEEKGTKGATQRGITYLEGRETLGDTV